MIPDIPSSSLLNPKSIQCQMEEWLMFIIQDILIMIYIIPRSTSCQKSPKSLRILRIPKSPRSLRISKSPRSLKISNIPRSQRNPKRLEWMIQDIPIITSITPRNMYCQMVRKLPKKIQDTLIITLDCPRNTNFLTAKISVLMTPGILVTTSINQRNILLKMIRS